MRKVLIHLAMLALCAAPAVAAPARHKLLVISVDGLDWRYLRDRDRLGLQIPSLRKLLAKSQVADGVVGVWPTVTWPSHTSMMTGLRPDQHGILANAGGPLDLSLSYWSAAKIKAPTLWQCAAKAGLTTAAVNWPVTATANITWNLPEIYEKRDGDSSDLETVDRYGTPGLVAEITRAHPSFGYRWLDDRTKTIAAIYLLKTKAPDLMLLHLAETDSEQHEEGPFTPHAMAVLERSDELIGDILKALPKGYDVALVSDHGFETVDHIANLKVMALADGVTGEMKIAGGLVSTNDPGTAAWLRALAGKDVVGREVPHGELIRYGGFDALAAFEPAPHVMFGDAVSGPANTASKNKGNHGFWPTRADYHSVFLLSGFDVKPQSLGTIEMVSLEDRFASALGLNCATP
ncbi:MAG TPA: ectonucleotide pyrophosphatase/phosphodiesterase [Rhizomicrobium sp.]|jgi:predicted AlkP superfamily pyrophosphatase or phosphodiesterase